MRYEPSFSIDDMQPHVGSDQQIRDQVRLVHHLDDDDESGKSAVTFLKDIPTSLVDHALVQAEHVVWPS